VDAEECSVFVCGKVEANDERIDMERLKVRDKISFYSDVMLFEDELHDSGCSVLNVKIVCFISVICLVLCSYFSLVVLCGGLSWCLSAFQRILNILYHADAGENSSTLEITVRADTHMNDDTTCHWSGFPHLENPGFLFVKFPGPGKCWKMGLVLDSPGNFSERSWNFIDCDVGGEN